MLRYEIASALTRAVDTGQLAEAEVELAWRATAAVPIRLHELETGTAVVEVARRLGPTETRERSSSTTARRTA